MDAFDANENVAAPNALAFIGNYLTKEDLAGPTVVNLVDVRAEAIEGEVKRKLVACFREYEKPLILNTTNIRRLNGVFGTSDTAAWRGPIILYVDEDVQFAGNKVGGIRVQAATEAGTHVGNGAILVRNASN